MLLGLSKICSVEIFFLMCVLVSVKCKHQMSIETSFFGLVCVQNFSFFGESR